jgi:hypothetical protein
MEDGETPEALTSLTQRIENGDDLKPFLSENIEFAIDQSEGTPRHLRKDLDLLLAEWGVHHLHLSMLRPWQSEQSAIGQRPKFSSAPITRRA